MTQFKNKFFRTPFGPSLLLLMITLFNHGQAQTVLLNVDRATDSIPSKIGPNLKRYIYPFMKFGFVLGPDEQGARIKYGSSVEFAIGFRTKYKIGSVYSLGWELQYNYTAFKLNQDSLKKAPNSFQNKKERIDFSAIRLGFFNRFNFDPSRGNTMGKYLDLCIAGEWNYGRQNVIKNELPDGSMITSVIRKQPYYTDLNAYAEARLGLGRLSLYANYRFTELFRPRFDFPEFPRMILGIELSLGN